jgi:hypothetical protein
MEKITFAAPEPETPLQPNKLLDIVRGMIVCGSVASMLAVFQHILSSNTLQIVRLKNRLEQPTDGGWGDCLLNLILKEGSVEKHVFELQIVPKLMIEAQTINAYHDYAVFRCARELLEVCGYDMAEDFYLTDLRKTIKQHELKQEYDRIPALQRKLAKLEPLLQQQAQLETDRRRLVLADNFTRDYRRVKTELAELKEKIAELKEKIENIKDAFVRFQHPFLDTLDTKYNQAYDNDDLDTAHALESLWDSALPICIDLVKATNAYSEAKAARQKASVVIKLKADKQRLESRLTELQEQLSRVTPVTRPMAIDERQVLMELFNATGGCGWTKNDNWKTNRQLATWRRVNVGEDGRVTHLRLSSNQLNGKRMSSSTPYRIQI